MKGQRATRSCQYGRNAKKNIAVFLFNFYYTKHKTITLFFLSGKHMKHLIFLAITITFCFTRAQNINRPMNNKSSDYKKIDAENMFNNIFNFPVQLEHAMRISQGIHYKRNYDNINTVICAGMGGSGIAGDIAQLFLKSKLSIPLITVKNYTLPQWCNEHTLVILLSYSGNTEETLSCFNEALTKKSHIIGITSGGKLQQRLVAHNCDIICIPSGLPPRAALGYLSIPILYCLYHLGLFPTAPTDDLINTISLLKESRTLFSQANNNNPAYKLAQQIDNSIPLIYGETETTASIAARWRAQLAENSKIIASLHALPELNHNEIVGWQGNTELLKNVGIIWLLDDAMHPRNKLRYNFTKNIISDRAQYQCGVTSKGNSFMERMFYLIHFGDWLSFWLAIMHEVNPTTIVNISQLKTAMSAA